MPINVPLLTKTLDHIVAHQEEWDQDFWLCDTSACFAGHAVLIDGGQCIETITKVFVRVVSEDDPADVRLFEGDPVINIPDRARRILGLSRPDAKRLFKGSNTLDDLRRIVGELCEDETP